MNTVYLTLGRSTDSATVELIVLGVFARRDDARQRAIAHVTGPIDPTFFERNDDQFESVDGLREAVVEQHDIARGATS